MKIHATESRPGPEPPVIDAIVVPSGLAVIQHHCLSSVPNESAGRFDCSFAADGSCTGYRTPAEISVKASYKVVDLLRRGEWSRAEPERSIGKGVQCAMDVERTIKSRTDGDFEADIENRAQVLGREARGDKQRESSDVGCRIPPPGDPPGVCRLCPVHDLL